MADRPALHLRMRSIVLTTLAIASLAGIIAGQAFAQSAPGAPGAFPQAPPMAPSHPQTLGMNDPRNPLHLTPDQQRKWQATQMKYQPQAQAIAQNQSLSPDKKKAMLAGLFKKASAELMTILTPAQRAQSQKLQKAAVARQTKLIQAIKTREAQIQKVDTQLKKSLTADQKKKLAALENQIKPQVEKLQKNPSMTPQQKQAGMNALGKTYMTQRDQILTPAQKTLMKKLQQMESAPLSPSLTH